MLTGRDIVFCCPRCGSENHANPNCKRDTVEERCPTCGWFADPQAPGYEGCPDSWHEVQPRHEEAHAQRCGCHNAATLNDTDDIVAARGWICIGNHTHPFVDDKCAAVRATHAEAVEAAEKRGERRYSCGAAKDCTRKPMFCGTHHLEIRDNLMAQARAAGVEEGRREMAKEVAERHRISAHNRGVYRISGCTFCVWLEARAGEEKKG